MRQRRTDACTTAPLSGPPEGPNPKFSNNLWVQTQEGQGRRPIVCGHRGETPASAAGGGGGGGGGGAAGLCTTRRVVTRWAAVGQLPTATARTHCAPTPPRGENQMYAAALSGWLCWTRCPSPPRAQEPPCTRTTFHGTSPDSTCLHTICVQVWWMEIGAAQPIYPPPHSAPSSILS